MLIKKKVDGHIVWLEFEKVKRYSNRFTLYKVYKNIGKSKKIFLYNTTLNDLELKDIIKKGYMMEEIVI